MEYKNVKLVIFTPLSHADEVRQALGEAGAGVVGDYDFCSFSIRGVGRFRGSNKSHPAIGKAEKHEAVEEEKIEVIVPRDILKKVIEAVKKVHPYEEVALYACPLEDL